MCRRTAASTGVGLSIAAFSARACSSAPGGGNGMTLDGMLFFWLKVDRYDPESSLVTRVMTTMNRFSVSGSEGGISAPHAAAVALARAVGCGRLERRDTL